MGVGIYFKKFFKEKPCDEWDFNSFCSFMRILGYTERSQIYIHYRRELNNIATDKNESESKRNAAESFLQIKKVFLLIIYILISN